MTFEGAHRRLLLRIQFALVLQSKTQKTSVSSKSFKMSRNIGPCERVESQASNPTPIALPRMVVFATGLAAAIIVIGFAFIAVIPLTISVIGIFGNRSGRVLRRMAAAWAAIYFTPLFLYLAQSTYPSMAQMYPLWADVLIALPEVGIAMRLLFGRH